MVTDVSDCSGTRGPRHRIGPVPSGPMSTAPPVRRLGVIVGSLRQASFNRRLALALQRLAPPSLQWQPIAVGDLPLINQDHESALPAPVQAFKQALAACDGLLLVTPEYNRSIPAPLKNAIDWASRPKGQNSLGGKPCAICGTSPGQLGSAAAQQHLRNVLSVLNAPTMSQPELFLHFTPELIAEDGSVANDATRQVLERYIAAVAAWVERWAA